MGTPHHELSMTVKVLDDNDDMTATEGSALEDAAYDAAIDEPGTDTLSEYARVSVQGSPRQRPIYSETESSRDGSQETDPVGTASEASPARKPPNGAPYFSWHVN